jgi:hypothetical protein
MAQHAVEPAVPARLAVVFPALLGVEVPGGAPTVVVPPDVEQQAFRPVADQADVRRVSFGLALRREALGPILVRTKVRPITSNWPQRSLL